MKIYLLVFLLPFSLFASKILSYNIYDRTDRVDVMITFDTPYNGAIKQSNTNSKIILKLENAQIESSKIKKISSKYLHSLTITPMSDYTQIVASVPSYVKLQASKTSDSYGLRLRFIDKSSIKQKEQITTNKSPFADLPTKKDEGISSSYYIVVSILIIGILILFWLKRKIARKSNLNEKSWLFKTQFNCITTHKAAIQNSRFKVLQYFFACLTSPP